MAFVYDIFVLIQLPRRSSERAVIRSQESVRSGWHFCFCDLVGRVSMSDCTFRYSRLKVSVSMLVVFPQGGGSTDSTNHTNLEATSDCLKFHRPLIADPVLNLIVIPTVPMKLSCCIGCKRNCGLVFAHCFCWGNHRGGSSDTANQTLQRHGCTSTSYTV